MHTAESDQHVKRCLAEACVFVQRRSTPQGRSFELFPLLSMILLAGFDTEHGSGADHHFGASQALNQKVLAQSMIITLLGDYMFGVWTPKLNIFTFVYKCEA